MYLLFDFFTKHNQNLARGAIILLVVLATLSVAQTVLFSLDMLTRTDEVVTQMPSADSRTPRVKAPPVSIAEFNLFGAVQSAPATSQAPVDAPETKLNLTLEGVFTAEHAGDSSAIVAEANRPGELYRVGDTLPGKVTLTAVFDDYVVFQRGTRYETLRFAEDKATDAGFSSSDDADLPQGELMPDEPAADANDASSSDDDDEPVRRVRRVAPGSAAARAAQGGNKTLGDMVDFYRERLRTDPDSLLADLGVEPVTSGESGGYRIGNQLSQQQLQQAGLMPGDVVLSVNGQPVNAVLQDQSLIDAAMASGRVRVEIQRQDRRFFITVPVR